MDGVLVDFESGAVDTINKSYKDTIPDSKKLRKLLMKIAAMSPPGVDLEISISDIKHKPVKITKRMKLVRDYMYRLLENNYDFWANLVPEPGYLKLWGYISQYNPYILSAPMQGEYSKEGKREWVRKNLTPQPKSIILDTEKYKYAIGPAGRPNVLIDDFTKNTIPWEQQGGIAILHTDINKTIDELEKIRYGGD